MDKDDDDDDNDDETDDDDDEDDDEDMNHRRWGSRRSGPCNNGSHFPASSLLPTAVIALIGLLLTAVAVVICVKVAKALAARRSAAAVKGTPGWEEGGISFPLLIPVSAAAGGANSDVKVASSGFVRA